MICFGEQGFLYFILMRRTQAQIREEEGLYGIHEVEGRWCGVKRCVDCGKQIQQTAKEKWILIRNMRKANICRPCSQTGERNSFFGKTHTAESKAANSASRTGKAMGAKNAMSKAEYRQKVSEQLKKKYTSGDLNFLKEIQRKNMTSSHANGKIVNTPISKEEKILRTELEARGLKIESQFKIGSLKYDLLVVDKKVLIEFNGDYWHCNPKQYAADYLNKKKGAHAHEIWMHDAHKKSTAESAGYRVITVWDSEYKRNKNTINKLIHAIEN